MVRGLPILAKNMCKTGVQYLGNAARYGVATVYMKLLKLYQLARSPLTHHDLERSNIAQFLLLCPALFYSALGHQKKWRGTVKNLENPACLWTRKLCSSTFKLLPAPLPTIMISSPYGSPIILVSGDITFIQKFEGGHPERGR